MLELESLIFQKSGLKKEEADTVADNLVQAEMRGIHSHGLIQTENYSKLMRAKKINPHSQIKIVQDGPGTFLFDVRLTQFALVERLCFKSRTPTEFYGSQGRRHQGNERSREASLRRRCGKDPRYR